MATIKYTGTPITLSTGQRHVVEVTARIVRVRLIGIMFETDKSFLLPGAMRGIRGLVNLYSEGMSVVVTGHTDRVGGASYNLGLSDERARAIAHYLRDEVDAWLAWYSDQPFSQPWGTREDQHMLSAIEDEATGDPFHTGDVDGIAGSQTRASVERYQTSRGLLVDGVCGPQTRRALVTDYMQLDETTLPADADVQLLGCGEHHNEVPTADGVEQADNRRAEIFLFDPGPVDPAVPGQCPGGGCPYETWKERTAETYDFEDERTAVNWDLFDFELLAHSGDEQHGAEA